MKNSELLARPYSSPLTGEEVVLTVMAASC